ASWLHRFDPVIRRIERRTQQLGHPGVNDGKVADRVTRFEVDDSRNKDRGWTDHRAAGLDNDRERGLANLANQGRYVIVRRHDRSIVVGDTEATADVEVL